jgi:hypothetical protein
MIWKQLGLQVVKIPWHSNVKGYHAIGLGQKPTSPEYVQIHTPMDSINNLHFGPIESGYSAFLLWLI